MTRLPVAPPPQHRGRQAARMERFPWFAAALGALAVAAGGLSLLRLPPAPTPAEPGAEPRPPALKVTELDRSQLPGVLQEELVLHDPTPLFLPTDWNSGATPDQRRLRIEPGATFGDFGEKLQINPERAAVEFGPIVPVPADPLSAAAALARRPALRELSRRELALEPLPQRFARLEIVAAGTGVPVLAEDWFSSGDRPAPSVLTQEFWAPMEALVAVEAAGVIGRPAMVTSSGSEAVDQWVLDFLTRAPHVGARLGPGFYRVLFGP